MKHTAVQVAQVKRLPFIESVVSTYPTRKTVDEWVLIAKERAHNNGGILERSSWLQQNGLGGLQYAIYHHPTKFVRIKQEKKGHTLADWIEIAKERAKKNRGILEHSQWLEKNGLVGLNHVMRRHPKRFVRIKQATGKPTPQEQLDRAVCLAKEYGNILPSKGVGVHGFIRNHRRLLLTKFTKVGNRTHGKWVLRSAAGLKSVTADCGSLTKSPIRRRHGFK